MSLRKLVGFIHPRIAVIVHDLLVVAVAWWVAKWLRYALRPDEVVSFQLLEFPLVLLVQGLIFRWTGLYKSVWRFASLPDLWNIVRASVIGSLSIGVCLFLYNRLEGVPRSVLLLYPGLLALLLGTPRLAYRYWKDSRTDLLKGQVAKRVLIVGADRAGEVLSRDLRRDSRYAVVGFVDDRPSLRGASINGHPVLGRFDQLPELARGAAVDMLLIALPGASTAEMRRVVALCDSTDLPYRTVPRLEDVVAGRASMNQIKEVAIEDLLGRDTVELDWTAIRETLSGRRVLVTGGGGSIGAVPAGGPAGCAVAHAGRTERVQPVPDHPGVACGLSRDDSRRCAGQLLRPDRDAQGVRRRTTAGGVPCRGVQARTDAAGTTAHGILQQRAGDPHGGRRGLRRRGDLFRVDLNRQGGQPDQRDGRLQARGRDLLPEPQRAGRHPFHDSAIRQRAGLGRLRRAAVSPADPRRRPGHRDPSGNLALFHDHSRGLPTDPADREIGRASCRE